MSVLAVIVAAGRGTRMRSSVPKPFLPLAGEPVLARTIRVFQDCPDVDDIIIVTARGYVSECRRDVVEKYGFTKVKAVVAGGRERQHSVYNALKKAPAGTRTVLVQDGVRPFVTREMIVENLEACRRHGAAVTAMPVKDTIKEVVRGTVKSTPPRCRLWAVQTPQTFRYETLLAAYERLLKTSTVVTDDAAVVERAGKKVAVVAGSYDNIKITTPEDMLTAERILKGRT